MGLKSDEKEQIDGERSTGWTGYLIFCNAAVIIGSSLMYGYNLCVVNAPYAVMSSYLNESYTAKHDGKILTKEELNLYWSLAVALYIIGGFIGSVWFPGALAGALGKKYALMVCAAIGVVGEAILFATPLTGHYIPFFVGRPLLGIQGGLSMTIAPGLITEQAPERLKGACGSLFSIGVVVGVLLSSGLGLTYVLGKALIWQYLFLIAAGFYALHGILLIFVVESPIYLVAQKRERDAIPALIKLRATTKGGAVDEIEQIKQATKVAAAAGVATVTVGQILKDRRFYWPMIVVINLHITNQLTGLGAAFFYSTKVLQEAGLDLDTAALANLGIAFATLFGNTLNMFVVDRLGRRPLQLSGLVGMVISDISLMLGLTYKVMSLSIFGFALFLFAYASGPGALPMFMTGELVTQAAKPTAFGLGMFISWGGSILVSFTFPMLITHLEQYCFLPFACIASIEFVFFLLFLPETSSLLVDFDPDRFAPGRSLLQLKRPPKKPARPIVAEVEEQSTAFTNNGTAV